MSNTSLPSQLSEAPPLILRKYNKYVEQFKAYREDRQKKLEEASKGLDGCITISKEVFDSKDPPGSESHRAKVSDYFLRVKAGREDLSTRHREETESVLQKADEYWHNESANPSLDGVRRIFNEAITTTNEWLWNDIIKIERPMEELLAVCRENAGPENSGSILGASKTGIDSLISYLSTAAVPSAKWMVQIAHDLPGISLLTEEE